MVFCFKHYCFDLVFKANLGGDIIPRSIVVIDLEGVAYVLCAMGEGALHSFILDRTTGLFLHANA